MSDELRAGMDELASEVEARHRRHPGLSVERIERAARGRRRRRTATLTAASVAAVAVLGLAGSALLRHPAPTPPVGSPAPTTEVTPSPSASTAPSASPSMTSARLPATKAVPSEPDSWVMTDATWAEVGPGWALAVFSTVAVIPDDTSYGSFDPSGTQALFLVAPDGTTYRVASLPSDAYAQVKWWDSEQRSAWVFFRGLGESWGHAQVDLRDGTLTSESAPQQAELAPVAQRPDGRVLWADVDPGFPGPVRGLYWLESDGSFVLVPGTTTIEGDAWLSPQADRVVFLRRDTTSGGGDRSLVSIDLTRDASDVPDVTQLAAQPGATGCSVTDVLDASVLVTCEEQQPYSTTSYEVARTGEWTSTAPSSRSPRLIDDMVMCGATDIPWTPNGRILTGTLGAQRWSDALVLPAPGGQQSWPNVSSCSP